MCEPQPASCGFFVSGAKCRKACLRIIAGTVSSAYFIINGGFKDGRRGLQPWYECCDSFGKVIFNYLTHISVKTILSTFALTLALTIANGATAQNRSTVSRSSADTVLLSESADGDYLVRRYVVSSDKSDGYSIRYLINSANLMPKLDGN